MKHKKMILFISLFLLVTLGALLPQMVTYWQKSHLQTVTFTQSRQYNTLEFDAYPRQYGDVLITNNFSAQNAKDALLDLVIDYMRAGLLPDLDIIHITMPEYYVYQDEQGENMLRATLQSGDSILELQLKAQERFPSAFSFRSSEPTIDAPTLTLLLSQYYGVKGAYTQGENGVCYFSAQDGTVAFTVTPLMAQSYYGFEVETLGSAAELQE